MLTRNIFNRTACITGTDRGIGLSLTQFMLREGFTVFAGGLQPNNVELVKLSEQYPEQLYSFHLDVGSDESVRAGAEFIRMKTDKLDLLINNAAILGYTDENNRG